MNPAEATPFADGLPDTAILPYVEALNRAGIETLQSCGGHPPGQRPHQGGHDGHLWFRASLDDEQIQRLARDPGLDRVAWLYAPEDCWEVWFRGLASKPEALRTAMGSLFAALGVPCP